MKIRAKYPDGGVILAEIVSFLSGVNDKTGKTWFQYVAMGDDSPCPRMVADEFEIIQVVEDGGGLLWKHQSVPPVKLEVVPAMRQ